MKRMILGSMVVMGWVACGGTPAATNGPTEPATATDPGPAPTPASGNARADLLAKLKAHLGIDTSQWPEEMSRVLEPGGANALVGATRDELLAALGEQNTGPEFQGEDRLAWHIGVVATARMGFPPVLVVLFDANGVATEAYFQLSM